MAREVSILRGLDWWTVLLYIGMMIFGWLNIYGASYNFDQADIFDFSHRAGKQFMWMMISLVLAISQLIIDHKVYDYFAYIFYGLIIVILLITPILAHNIKGSNSWISLGPISLQPAEFAKCFTALALAKYMGRDEYHLLSWRDMIIPGLLVLLPMAIIMVPQKETGTALVFAAFLLMFYREGMSGYILLSAAAAVAFFIIVIRFNTPLPIGAGSYGICVSLLLIILIEIIFLWQKIGRGWASLWLAVGVSALYGIGLLLNIWFTVNFNWLSVGIIALSTIYLAFIAFRWRHNELWLMIAFVVTATIYCFFCTYAFNRVLQPHQQVRIEVLLGMKDDPSGAGYNVNQSKIAIGSGGWKGKGYLHGTQTKLKFVPEQATDFIFCTVGEEWGFVGAAGVLIFYMIFIFRLILMAERQRTKFSRIYGYCVASIFSFHLAINVGMVLGLLPVIGIPLPFFSYGGSSLCGFTLLLFTFLKMDAARLGELRN